MKKIDIKGKEYTPVNERIKYFYENNPNGSIITEILEDEDGRCIVKATVYVDGEIKSTGHAYEVEGNSFINKTSYLENCETSAVGRALGIMGIGLDESVASYEEVANAVTQQENDVQISEEVAKNIENELKEIKADIKGFCKYFKVSSIEQLSTAQMPAVKKMIKKKKDSMPVEHVSTKDLINKEKED